MKTATSVKRHREVILWTSGTSKHLMKKFRCYCNYLNKNLYPIIAISTEMLIMRRLTKPLSQKTCKKPQGVGLFFLLGLNKIGGKKPHPPGAFPEIPLYPFKTFFFFKYC